MTPASIVAIVLALAAASGCARLLWRWRREPAGDRAWRWILLLLAQPLFAALLFFALHPPERAVHDAATLTVLAEAATAREADASRASGPVLALPEAPAMRGVERVPDLGTALRRHPGVATVHVVGRGLPERDRDAARAAAIVPLFAPLPRGLVRLYVPDNVAVGGVFTVSGEVAGVEGGRVELVDPAGRRVDVAELDEAGPFALDGTAFESGDASHGLRVLDADGRVVEVATVALWIDAPKSPRVLSLAGAPNPETRALHRWMREAGFDVDARISLGGGIALGDAPAMTREALARFDLMVVDARAWNDLDDARRARVLDAVQSGMGLLVRADLPLGAAASRSLRATGFDLAGGNATAAFQIASRAPGDEAALRARLGVGSADAPVDIDAARERPPTLSRRALRVSGVAAVPLARDAAQGTVAWWRQAGLGRLALWTPLDTWRLPMHDRGDLFADLWNDAFTTLVRPRPIGEARLDGDQRVDARIAICGVSDAAFVDVPGAGRVALQRDPQAGGCAAYWPATPGWHRLRDGERVLPFHVRGARALPGVRAMALRDETLRLASRPVATRTPTAASTYRTSPWPWFAAWLALAALLWWFERSTPGRRSVVSREDATPGMR